MSQPTATVARWLQYWYFYFYNDYNLIGHLVPAGLHQGDWEMVQIRLGADNRPDHAVYAQHDHAHGRRWDEVELVPGSERPVVYVARGSHASYFEPGTKWTGHWFDYADAKRLSPARQRLEIITDGDPEFAWISWPGCWGDPPKHGGIAPADSPPSPGVRDSWRDPLALLQIAAQWALEPLPPRPTLPPAPTVSAAWNSGVAQLSYAVAASADGSALTTLTITLNSKDEPTPPSTDNVAIDALAGVLDLAGLQANQRYDIYVSGATADGLSSESVRLDLAPAIT